MPYPWALTILYVFFYFGIFTILFSRIGKEIGEEAMFAYPEVVWGATACLCSLYLWYCYKTGGVELRPGILTPLYFLLPCWLLWQARDKGNRITFWDWTAIAAFWLPFDLHWIGQRHHPIKDALDWPITGLSAVIIALVFWVSLRKIDDTKTVFSFRWKDLVTVGLGLSALLIILLPLGFALSFLHPRDFWSQELQNSSLYLVIWRHLASFQFLISLATIYVTIGLSEEFLFRGIIQNFLDKTLRSKTASWLLASVLFGTAHLNNHATSLHPAGWNWSYALMATVAGMAYGQVFRRTSSLLYPMLLHSLVDAIWHTFFK